MRLHAIVLSTIALTTSGCGLGCGELESGTYEVDKDVTLGEMHRTLLNSYVDTSTELPCRDICAAEVLGGRVGSALGYDDACTYEAVREVVVSDTADTGMSEPEGDPEEVVGRLRCSGTWTDECIGGRRPLGHVEATVTDGTRLAQVLAGNAHLEAASVLAFQQLAEQLRSLGAPRRLIEACHDAARDEVRHATLVGNVARRLGVDVPEVCVGPTSDDLLTIALHNATEGCVREAWASVLAHVHAQRAADPELRAIYRLIADDETRHAQLAWDLHAWLCAQLTDAQRDQVEAAQAQALATLPDLVARELRTWPTALGLPSPDEGARMATHFAERLAA